MHDLWPLLQRIDSSIYILSAGSADTNPTNSGMGKILYSKNKDDIRWRICLPDGEGEKNIDFAVRLDKFLGNSKFIFV
jgi:hypothetical protein